MCMYIYIYVLILALQQYHYVTVCWAMTSRELLTGVPPGSAANPTALAARAPHATKEAAHASVLSERRHRSPEKNP